MTHEETLDICNQVIDANAESVQDAQRGIHGAVMFLVGQYMRKTKGLGNASEARLIMEQRILQ